MNKVDVFTLDRRFKRLERPIRQAAVMLMKLMRRRCCVLNIYLVNREVMDKNVLAFPAPKGFPNPDSHLTPLGEIFLSPDYIKRERLEVGGKGLEMTNEKFVYMLIHGFLHLLGYDHKNKRDRIRMERKEAGLLSRITNF